MKLSGNLFYSTVLQRLASKKELDYVDGKITLFMISVSDAGDIKLFGLLKLFIFYVI